MGRSGDRLEALVAVVLVAAAALLAGCSDDGDAEPVATGTVVESTAPTTSAPPTTAAPTTEVPTTTLDEAAQLAAEVEADLRETVRLTDIAFQDPNNEAKVAAALEGYVESNREFIAGRVEELRANGHVAKPNPEIPAQLIIETRARLADNSADTAVVQVCEVDSWIIVEPGAGPDGGDAIIDSDVVSFRSNFVMVKVGDAWRVRGGESLGEWSGAGCPAA